MNSNLSRQKEHSSSGDKQKYEAGQINVNPGLRMAKCIGRHPPPSETNPSMIGLESSGFFRTMALCSSLARPSLYRLPLFFLLHVPVEPRRTRH